MPLLFSDGTISKITYKFCHLWNICILIMRLSIDSVTATQADAVGGSVRPFRPALICFSDLKENSRNEEKMEQSKIQMLYYSNEERIARFEKRGKVLNSYQQIRGRPDGPRRNSPASDHPLSSFSLFKGLK